MKKFWFQLHWFVGITAGTILILIGLTGSILSFREELLDFLNPGVRNIAVQDAPVLAPPQIAAAARVLRPDARIASIIIYSEPGSTARVGLAPGQNKGQGEQRGEVIFLNPYNGALLPPLHYDEVFEWVDSLHRHLLLPRDAGRIALGILALCLLGLSLSGLYLRWPRRVGDWRAWLKLDLRLKGRSFLWGLHSVVGTWMLVGYVIFTLTGVYWSFDVVRSSVDGWLGVTRVAREAPGAKPPKGVKPPPADLAASWATFEQAAPDWRMAFLRIPERSTAPLQIVWTSKDAPHVRARGRMTIDQATGAMIRNDPYADMTLGGKAQSSIYALHVGSFFGMPGRVVMFIVSLALPGFAITGWMLYLNRRKQKRIAAAERRQFAATSLPVDANAADPVLLAYASQTGQAERLALQSAAALQAAGVAVHVHSLEKLTPPQLVKYRRALFVASSFGEGEPPDGARRFSRLLHAAAEELAHMQYAVLALGDRNYVQFCGFGHALDARLRTMGAQPLHPTIEVDNGDAAALARWSGTLRGLIGADAPEMALTAAVADTDYASWRMVRRELLNPGSVGDGLYEITLAGPADASWRPGALVDVWPGHYTPAAHGQPVTPATPAVAMASDMPAVQVAPRRYSLASLPADGVLQLLVRQVRHDGGLGLASGWLTDGAQVDDEVRLRLIANPAFDQHAEARPSVYIGNGSGLAGLRAHLRARVQAGQGRNWLIFGERQREFDSVCADEIAGWRAAGMLPELDLVFSRDVTGGEYVQDRMRVRADVLRDWLADGAVLYVCGSLQGMAGGVDAALEDMIGRAALDDLIETGRYRRDVY